VQLEHFERPLNDDAIRHVLVTQGFFSEKQAFESDRLYRDAVEIDRRGRRSTDNQHRAHGAIAIAA
jgi:hypothetical protein